MAFSAWPLANRQRWVDLFFPLNDAACQLGGGDAGSLEGVNCDRGAASGVAVEDQLLVARWTG